MGYAPYVIKEKYWQMVIVLDLADIIQFLIKLYHFSIIFSLDPYFYPLNLRKNIFTIQKIIYKNKKIWCKDNKIKSHLRKIIPS